MSGSRTALTTAVLYRQKAALTRYKKRTALEAVLSGKIERYTQFLYLAENIKDRLYFTPTGSPPAGLYLQKV